MSQSATSREPSRRSFVQTAMGAGVAVAVLPVSAQTTPTPAGGPAASKEIANLNVPWEEAYGYAQAVKVDNIIYVSGQLSHDADGKLVGPAPLGASGRPSDFKNMGLQMQTTYENARKLLARFGATFDQVVEETLYVIDVPAAFAVAGKVRRGVYGGTPRVASNLIGVSSLAFPEQLIEIAFRVDLSLGKR